MVGYSGGRVGVRHLVANSIFPFAANGFANSSSAMAAVRYNEKAMAVWGDQLLQACRGSICWLLWKPNGRAGTWYSDSPSPNTCTAVLPQPYSAYYGYLA